MTSAERNREMGVINLVTPEKQRQIDEIKKNLVKLRIPEELRNKMLNEIDSFLKIWPQSIDWFDMPQEMRELVIEEMDAKTKCKFTQCSKKCEDEVKNSKHFLTGIKIGRSNNPEIRIGLGRHSDFHYCLEFIDVTDLREPKTKVVYKNVSQENEENRLMRIRMNNDENEKDEKWTKMEDGNAEEVRLKYFNEYIQKYSRTIETLVIHDYDFEFSNFDWQQLTSLKYFNSCCHHSRDGEWMNLAQIKKLNKCIMPETGFTFEEIIQFEGQFYHIVCYDVNEENVEKYLKMLKNGEVHRNMERLDVYSGCSPFAINFGRIAKSLDGFDFEEDDYDVRFRFLLNYQRTSKCYCEVVGQTANIYSFIIVSDDYDEVMKNRQPLDF